MRSSLVVLIVAVGLALPAFAGDIVDMPTGNMVPPKNFEVNYIYWDIDTPPGPAPNHIHIFEAFVGITDWLELDAIVADAQNDDTYVKFNVYGRVLEEKPGQPGVIVGATNITESDWIGNDNISPFILAAYNLMAPAGPPTWSDPLLRAHLAYGWEAHGDKLFGGLQALFTPEIGVGVFNYQDQPAYVGVYRPAKTWELRAGWKNGDPFYSVGGFFNW